MKALGEVILAVTDLVEAEAVALRRGAAKLVLASVLMITAAFFVFIGVAMLVWGVYGLLAAPLGVGGAAAIGAGVALFSALFIAVVAKWIAH
jgi:hypothetical protein